MFQGAGSRGRRWCRVNSVPRQASRVCLVRARDRTLLAGVWAVGVRGTKTERPLALRNVFRSIARVRVAAQSALGLCGQRTQPLPDHRKALGDIHTSVTCIAFIEFRVQQMLSGNDATLPSSPRCQLVDWSSALIAMPI